MGDRKEHPQMSSAERQRKSKTIKAAGLVRLVIYAERLWWAETLFAGGFIAHPDDDSREELEDGTQALVDHLTQETKGGHA